jgi:tetratricopeptide (TPR) repeat protein/predicted Ser/Thr protein kinase
MQCLDPNAIVAFLEGNRDRDRIDAHVDQCPACRSALAAAVCGITPSRDWSGEPDGGPADQRAVLRRGAVIGRYRIEDLIGAGGMGVVYAARDPELDRRVALKIVRRGGRDDWQERLIEEARAVARLSHRNVVAVFDAGRADDGAPFLAMELVEGQTLRTWLAAAPRGPREVLSVFVEAGRGLEAAHAAGLVHGDFKPENVLVGDDGRVCVTDFGLCRPIAGQAAVPRAIAGTAAYMAPEQMRAGTITPAADQYAFCVALAEALPGHRPIRRIVQRGWSAEPGDRFASMAVVAGALDRIARRPRRRGWLLAGAGALAAAAILAPLALGAPPGVACDPAAELTGLWDGRRRRAVERAFRSTGVPYAAASWRGFERGMNGYLDRWSASFRRACAAGESDRDRAQSCLEGRRRDVDELVSHYLQAPAASVERAVSAASGLAPPEMCLDRRTAGPPAGDPAVEALRARLRRARVRADAIELSEAIGEAGAVAAGAAALGDRALEAEALLARGLFEARLGANLEAEASLAAAGRAADRAGDDVLRARAWQERGAVARARGQSDEALAHLAIAEAAVERAGRPQLLRAELLWIRAGVLSEMRRPGEARPLMEEAVATYDRLLGPDSVRAANALSQLGNIDREERQLARAMIRHARAHRVLAAALGRDHPVAAAAVGNLCADESSAGLLHHALAHCHAALVGFERSLGRAHIKTGMAEAGIAEVHAALGDLDEAERHARRGLDIITAAAGAEHPLTATARGILAGLRAPRDGPARRRRRTATSHRRRRPRGR